MCLECCRYVTKLVVLSFMSTLLLVSVLYINVSVLDARDNLIGRQVTFTNTDTDTDTVYAALNTLRDKS